MTARKLALITGASGGIGESLARLHAKKGGDLVLVARSKDKLEALAEGLKEEHGVSCHVVALDLARREAARDLVEELRRAGLFDEVQFLVNNAGFGGHGLFYERDWNDDQAMLDLNVHTLTALTRLFLPMMVERGSGRILNLASTAAFMPGPLQAVYFASKAYVLSFTEAIANELKGTGVTATALCPGYTETGFKDAANLEGTGLVKASTQTPDEVARCGYDAMMAGKPSVVSGLANKALTRFLIRLIPRSAAASVARKLQEKNSG